MGTPGFVYRRISDDREGREVGVGRQLDDCRELATQHGIDITAVFTDNDISASTNSNKPRPDYEEMMRRAGAGEAGAILAYSNSRLTRRPREFADLVDLYKARRVRIITAVSGEDNLDTADGRMVAWFKAVADAAEAERTSERVKRAMRDLIRDGKPRGGVRPFGYASHDVIDEAEAEWVRWMYREYLAGASLGSIAAALNAAGVTTSLGNEWNRITLRAMLLRPRSAGLIVHNDQIIGEAPWPALVDRETFDQACALLRAKVRPPMVRRGFLSGIVRCGEDGCDGKAILFHATNRGKEIRLVYRCHRSPAHFGRGVQLVDDYVTGRTLRVLSSEDDFDTDTPRPAVDVLSLRRRRSALASLIASGALPPEDGEAQIKQLARGIAEAEAANSAPRFPPTVAKLAASADVPAAWHALDLDRRRAVVSALFDIRVRKMRPGDRPGSVDGIAMTRR